MFLLHIQFGWKQHPNGLCECVISWNNLTEKKEINKWCTESSNFTGKMKITKWNWSVRLFLFLPRHTHLIAFKRNAKMLITIEILIRWTAWMKLFQVIVIWFVRAFKLQLTIKKEERNEENRKYIFRSFLDLIANCRSQTNI